MNKPVWRKILIGLSITFFVLAPLCTYFFTGPLSHLQCEIQQPENGWCELGAGVIIGPVIFLVTAALGGALLALALRIKR